MLAAVLRTYQGLPPLAAEELALLSLDGLDGPQPAEHLPGDLSLEQQLSVLDPRQTARDEMLKTASPTATRFWGQVMHHWTLAMQDALAWRRRCAQLRAVARKLARYAADAPHLRHAWRAAAEELAWLADFERQAARKRASTLLRGGAAPRERTLLLEPTDDAGVHVGVGDQADLVRLERQLRQRDEDEEVKRILLVTKASEARLEAELDQARRPGMDGMGWWDEFDEREEEEEEEEEKKKKKKRDGADGHRLRSEPPGATKDSALVKLFRGGRSTPADAAQAGSPVRGFELQDLDQDAIEDVMLKKACMQNALLQGELDAARATISALQATKAKLQQQLRPAESESESESESGAHTPGDLSPLYGHEYDDLAGKGGLSLQLQLQRAESDLDGRTTTTGDESGLVDGEDHVADEQGDDGVVDELRATMEQLQTQVDELTGQLTVAQDMASTSRDEAARLQQDKGELAERLRLCNDRLEQLRQAPPGLEAAQKRTAELMEENEGLDQRNRDLTEQVNSLVRKNTQLLDDHQRLQGLLDAVQEQQEQEQEQEQDRSAAKVDTLRARVDELQRHLDAAKAEVQKGPSQAVHAVHVAHRLHHDMCFCMLTHYCFPGLGRWFETKHVQAQNVANPRGRGHGHGSTLGCFMFTPLVWVILLVYHVHLSPRLVLVGVLGSLGSLTRSLLSLSTYIPRYAWWCLGARQIQTRNVRQILDHHRQLAAWVDSKEAWNHLPAEERPAQPIRPATPPPIPIPEAPGFQRPVTGVYASDMVNTAGCFLIWYVILMFMAVRRERHLWLYDQQWREEFGVRVAKLQPYRWWDMLRVDWDLIWTWFGLDLLPGLVSFLHHSFSWSAPEAITRSEEVMAEATAEATAVVDMPAAQLLGAQAGQAGQGGLRWGSWQDWWLGAARQPPE
ncbi:hypothetical protein P8C59_009162 [Phyllachora maydis]|nr:hypothetical protein P8C59_009162 [Phyllachora maydis]